MARSENEARPFDGVVVGSADVGRLELRGEEIEINAGRRTVELTVANTGDRPVQVGSHFHFFEANGALAFDRARAFGLHLDIPSGTAVRFEPGEEKKVGLTEYAGKQVVYGFNGLTNGSVRDSALRSVALRRARAEGFMFDREA